MKPLKKIAACGLPGLFLPADAGTSGGVGSVSAGATAAEAFLPDFLEFLPGERTSPFVKAIISWPSRKFS